MLLRAFTRGEDNVAKNKRSKVKRFFSLTKIGIIRALNFRGHFFISIIGQLAFLIVIYFLWRSIYAASPTDVVNGMTFMDTLIYLVLANALASVTNTYIIYNIGTDIQSGRIVLDMLKPVPYFFIRFAESSGIMIVQFVTYLIPSFLIVYFLSGRAIHLGINLIFFIIGIILGAMINFCLNLCFACFTFYTENCWGINIVKECFVGLLSGAVIPIAFFPQWLKNIVNFLPFPAILNAPLQMLLGNNTSFEIYGYYLLLQIFWLVVMYFVSQALWHRCTKVLTINGG